MVYGIILCSGGFAAECGFSKLLYQLWRTFPADLSGIGYAVWIGWSFWDPI